MRRIKALVNLHWDDKSLHFVVFCVNLQIGSLGSSPISPKFKSNKSLLRFRFKGLLYAEFKQLWCPPLNLPERTGKDTERVIKAFKGSISRQSFAVCAPVTDPHPTSIWGCLGGGEGGRGLSIIRAVNLSSSTSFSVTVRNGHWLMAMPPSRVRSIIS